jgi:transcriptional regulator with XRE-family HTH domain
MPKSLGSVLKQARERQNLSLRDVEKRTGIRNAHLSQIENETITKPEMAMLWDLAALYGLDYTQLLRLAGYRNSGQASGRERQRKTAALRALGELSAREQTEALRFMADLKAKRVRE